MRLDVALVKMGLAESRSKAKYLIENGQVLVNGVLRTKPALEVSETDTIDVLRRFEFVSRAGYKLEKLLLEYPINLSGKVACDVGSSTGGFVQCLLLFGVSRVYAVDVNPDQLHPSLKADKRVVQIVKNAKCLAKEDFSEPLDLITVDLSFISVTKVVDALAGLIGDEGVIIVLIKPQFELGRPHAGVVSNRVEQVRAIGSVIRAFAERGLCATYLTHSKIKGKDGNIEFFGIFSRSEKSAGKIHEDGDIIGIVEKAWEDAG